MAVSSKQAWLVPRNRMICFFLGGMTGAWYQSPTRLACCQDEYLWVLGTRWVQARKNWKRGRLWGKQRVAGEGSSTNLTGRLVAGDHTDVLRARASVQYLHLHVLQKAAMGG